MLIPQLSFRHVRSALPVRCDYTVVLGRVRESKFDGIGLWTHDPLQGGKFEPCEGLRVASLNKALKSELVFPIQVVYPFKKFESPHSLQRFTSKEGPW